jgi:hypothetical protein
MLETDRLEPADWDQIPYFDRRPLPGTDTED